MGCMRFMVGTYIKCKDYYNSVIESKRRQGCLDVSRQNISARIPNNKTYFFSVRQSSFGFWPFFVFITFFSPPGSRGSNRLSAVRLAFRPIDISSVFACILMQKKNNILFYFPITVTIVSYICDDV